jgi:hypothetical protein
MREAERLAKRMKADVRVYNGAQLVRMFKAEV